jgi:hypothetical protein
MKSQSHIVQKLKLDLSVPDQSSARQIQNRVSELCKDQLPHILDRMLSEIFPPERFLRFDRLEIDLGDIGSDALEDDFSNMFEHELRKVLAQGISEMTTELNLRGTLLPPDVGSSIPEGHPGAMVPAGPDDKKNRTLSRADRDLEIVLFFLETGTFPWFALVDNAQSISDTVTRLIGEVPSKMRPALTEQLKNSVSRRRAIYQFDDALLKKILSRVLPKPSFDSGELTFLVLQIYVDMGIPDVHRNELRYPIWDAAIASAVFEATREMTVSAMIGAAMLGIASRIPGKAAEFLENLGQILSKEIQWPIAPQMVRQLAAFKRRTSGILETGGLDVYSEEKTGQIQGPKNGETLFPEIGSETISGNEEESQHAATPPFGKQASGRSFENQTLPNSLKVHAGRPDTIELSQWHDPSSKQADRDTTEHPSFSLYVQNAGLVLFHPYLSRFFENLEIANNGRFENDSLRVRAAVLLQRLASRKPNPPEYLLPLNKILCGLHADAPVPCDIHLTDQEIKTCDKLLETVVEHWAALKTTSIEGLRKSFVQREGILEREDRNWRLRVERKSFDLLLEKLPWSLSMIRLSWMKSLLLVEW